jgi:hypothetical protein
MTWKMATAACRHFPTKSAQCGRKNHDAVVSHEKIYSNPLNTKGLSELARGLQRRGYVTDVLPSKLEKGSKS